MTIDAIIHDLNSHGQVSSPPQLADRDAEWAAFEKKFLAHKNCDWLTTDQRKNQWRGWCMKSGLKSP